MNERKYDFLHGKIIMTINLFEKQGEQLKQISTKFEKINAGKLKKDLIEDENRGIKHKIEIVNEKPEKFRLNTIYLLLDSKRAWVYLEK